MKLRNYTRAQIERATEHLFDIRQLSLRDFEDAQQSKT